MTTKRWGLIGVGCLGLMAVYLSQNYLDFYSLLFKFRLPQYLEYDLTGKNITPFPFIINKSLRYLVNDLFSIAIIAGIFGERKYVRFAVYVMFFGLFILLPLYIWLFLNQSPGFSSMLSHLHRIVMNPVLMMLLIPAFFYQRHLQKQQS